MASATLPPRQKMINMMYLVLTAMLAMNVSKEVLDAFAIMDAELVRSEQAHAGRSQLEYAVFADAAKRFPEKFSAAQAKALAVKLQADSLVSMIERTKTTAIAEADGVDAALLRGMDANGRDTLRALLALDAKDDREVLTRIMVGPEPAAPHRSPGGAYALKNGIATFRDSLKHLVSGRGPELEAALDLLFELGDRRDASGTLNNWESINFYDVPLAAGIATLSKLQADIRSAENDMVRWLYRSVELNDHKFSTLVPAVIPQNNLIMVGDSFRADVFLAAYDPRNAPAVSVNGGGVLPIGGDGKAKLRVRGDQVGEQVVEGTIRMDGPKGVEEYPYSVAYQVMAPLLVASPTKMNVLYRGVDNPIDLSVPGVAPSAIQASITSGRLVRQGQGWVANGLTGNTAEVFASVAMPDGTTRRIGPVRFRVKDLPPPTAYVAGTDPNVTKAPKPKLTASQGLVAKPLGSDFADQWTVLSFTLTVVRKGAPPVELFARSNAFTPEMRTVLAAVRPGDMVYVGDVRSRLANGQGPVRELSPIALKVLP